MPNLRDNTSNVPALPLNGATVEPPFLLTKSEVAETLRCSTRTVDRAVKSGKLKPVRLTPGGWPKFPRDQVLKLMGLSARKSHLAAWHQNQDRAN